MDLFSYLSEESLILVPVIWVIGIFLKKTPKIPDWFIPWILLIISVVAMTVKLGFALQAFIQGILITGVSVLGHQLVKQTAKRS
ncbi:Phage holin family Hol44, holin superfamily V [Caminicella sporogenes DSM 14501]|uniref:Phage holin family Hol44, holin superfamily V n=1 Tax=Caminicella sporogenes DSM 14501 TaxID=1121266 RepID=A0A1M6NMM8_9FIRM|nr:phage holin family protein [Caminicella sporogenes]RKD22150.1 holin [Caminicella sporogenes]SHJ96991.1 Phage holin family Hol44, holin superfamily V [Caminicella sporogenes DSM 14501]